MSDNDIEIHLLKKQITELQKEYEEFQCSSKELESELEKELEQREIEIHNLKCKLETQSYEKQELQMKFKAQLQEQHLIVMKKNEELELSQKKEAALKKNQAALEERVEQLENQLRIKDACFSELEAKYHESLEKNAMISAELESKSADEEIQRLKDEVKDLRDEISSKCHSSAITPPVVAIRDMTSRIKSLEEKLSSCRSLLQSPLQ